MMTTTSAKTVRTPEAPANNKPAATAPGKRPEAKPLRQVFGKLAVDAYERGVADVVFLEKEAATMTRVPWAKSALRLHADFLEDVGAAYVRTARAILR